MELFPEFIGFDWNDANRQKNWQRHRVAWWECEEMFFNQPLYILPDQKHSISERRLYALGMSNAGRMLFIVFTQRNKKIRIISARDMNKKERKVYVEKAQEDSKA